MTFFTFHLEENTFYYHRNNKYALYEQFSFYQLNSAFNLVFRDVHIINLGI